MLHRKILNQLYQFKEDLIDCLSICAKFSKSTKLFVYFTIEMIGNDWERNGEFTEMCEAL